MGHYDASQTDFWGVPEYLVIKIIIRQEIYTEIFSDFTNRFRANPLAKANPVEQIAGPDPEGGMAGVLDWYLNNYPHRDSDKAKQILAQVADYASDGSVDTAGLNRIEPQLGVAIHRLATGAHVYCPEDAPRQEKFPDMLLEKHCVYPLHVDSSKVFLLSEQQSNYSFEDEWVSMGNEVIEVVPVIADQRAIRDAIGRNRSNLKTAEEGPGEVIDEDDLHFANDTNMVDIDPSAVEEIDPQNINLLPEEVIHWVLYTAIIQRASDLHLERYYNMVRFRARIDGGLKVIHTAPEEMLQRYTAILKNYANMQQTRQECQDARFAMTIGKRRVDVRVSAVPCRNGFQKVTMRFLDKQDGLKRLGDLNLSQRQTELFKKAMGRDQGLALVTGPTGSGKTTTLYALIDSVNKPDVNIHTIEDPIEYEIEGINQTQTDVTNGISFLHGLRALLRADPDILLIGESRDEETANAAINSALTGHLVLTTLHANDCVRAVTRLLSMNVEPYLLADCLALSQAQRLVRGLCSYCKRSITVSDEVTEVMMRNGVITGPVNDPMFEAVGCPECHGTGYHGRVALMEMTDISPKMTDLIARNAAQSELREAVSDENFLTLYQEGLLQVLAGKTSMREIARLSYTGL